MYILGYLGGPGGGVSMLRLDLSCFPAILSPIYMYMSNKEAIWCLSLNPKYDFFLLFSYLGGPGGPPLRWTQVNENVRAVRSHHRVYKFITRGKNNHLFFIYGPQCEKKIAFWAIRGALGGPYIIGPDPSCRSAILSPIAIYIIKYGSNPKRIFKVIVRTMKCLRTQRRRRNDD